MGRISVHAFLFSVVTFSEVKGCLVHAYIYISSISCDPKFKTVFKTFFRLWSYSYGAQLHSTSTWITVTVYSKKKNMQLVGCWRLNNHVYIWGGKELFYNKDNSRNHALETLERLVNAQSFLHRVFTGHGLFWFHLGASKRACQALVFGSMVALYGYLALK